MIIDIEKIIAQQNLLQKLPYKTGINQNIIVDVLRLDKIDVVASGNKLFKLDIPLKKAVDNNCTTIITTGGPYSNHLIATAYICKTKGLHSVGIVKAHHTMKLTPTLQDCTTFGMGLIFMQPTDFNNKEKLEQVLKKYDNSFWIDMGGYSEGGTEGCTKILPLIDYKKYTHIITAVGTGTTLAGLSLSALKHQKIVGISSMKGNSNLQTSIERLLNSKPHAAFELIHDFNFGGFAKHPSALIDFMNDFYEQYDIPTDIVYTGKVFYAVNRLIEASYFPPNSKLLVIHTGGLQGNRSLPINTLVF